MKKLVFLLAIPALLLGLGGCAGRSPQPKPETEINTTQAGTKPEEPASKEETGTALRLAAPEESFEETVAFTADDPGEAVTICADGPVTKVRVCRAVSEDGIRFSQGELLCDAGELGQKKALLLTVLIPEGMPNLAVTCTLADGSVRAYTLTQSGKDGTISLTEFTDNWELAS